MTGLVLQTHEYAWKDWNQATQWALSPVVAEWYRTTLQNKKREAVTSQADDETHHELIFKKDPNQ